MRSLQLPQHVTPQGASGAPRDLRTYGLREHLATLFRHKLKMLAVLFSCLFVAVAGSYLASKVFIAGSRILVQIEREPLRLGSITGGEPMAMETRAREQVLTEAEIFRSPLLAQELARRLGPDYVQQNLTWRWDRIRNLPDTVKTAIKNGLFAFGPTRALLLALGMEPEGEEDEEIKILLVGGLIGDHFDVEPILQTDVMAATFKAPDPIFAAQALNELVDIYLDHHLKLRQRPAAMEIVDAEALRLKDRLDTAENRLREFKQEAQIVSIDAQKEHLLGELSDVRAKLFEARSQLSESTGRIAEIGKQLRLQSNAQQLSTVM
ncbi:MAG: hypothetical protein HKO62_06010, partial [Gammaproteobacteria bacterium]|nr:hypothetical protein [Gammaproteobacteria bacterium]